jgi:methylenetetrahydrofolate dehydrogenase (NADP+)/methenyltetrahydrofolate cyclohydrolase
MRLIDGRAIATAIAAEVTEAVSELRSAGTVPALAVVLPAEDEAARWYVRSIQRQAAKVGIDCVVHDLAGPGVGSRAGTGAGTGAGAVRDRLSELSADPAVHGIICQTPLPQGISLEVAGASIAPAKDVDGANPVSLGRLAAGLPSFAPATAAAVLEILRRERVPLSGTRAVVVGRSVVVGKPAALLLLAENATVTICHSATEDLAGVCAEADVLVAAVGRARLIGAGYIKPGAVVIDVGTNPTPDGGLAGDVDAEALGASGAAGALTPVPGGVGPVTTMLLMRHTVQAAGGGTLAG